MAAAHITPLEEGGRTDFLNLIPLCEGTTKLSIAIARALAWSAEDSSRAAATLGAALDAIAIPRASIGCHQLLDAPLIPKSRVRALRLDSLGCPPATLRSNAFDTPLKDLRVLFSPVIARRSAIAALEGRIAAGNISSTELFQASCSLLSHCRRVASRVSFRKAALLVSVLDQQFSSLEGCSALRLASWYLYEKALYLMVRNPSPDREFALQCLEHSCAIAEQAAAGATAPADRTASLRSAAMSRLEWVHVMALHSPTWDVPLRNTLDSAMQSAIGILKPGLDTRDPDSLRYQVNLCCSLSRIELRSGALNRVRETITRGRLARDDLTVATGWAQLAGITFLKFESILKAKEHDYSNALTLLARTLSLMRASRAQRPEGFLEVAATAAWVFSRLNMEAEARKVDVIAQRMVDGRSGEWQFA